MKPEFWHQKWENNQIGFHNDVPHPLLVHYFGELDLSFGSRVFVPLCGKTRDIHWLLSEGYKIVGAELSEKAIQELFFELDKKPTVTDESKLKKYSTQNIEIFVGDIFDLTGTMLGTVDAIYDRAALVALPLEMRNKYTALLKEITDDASQLLICFEYDQSLRNGPPFSITQEELEQHYAGVYNIRLLEQKIMPGGLGLGNGVTETIWLLK
jgi:thiopurine S-methyltransferase